MTCTLEKKKKLVLYAFSCQLVFFFPKITFIIRLQSFFFDIQTHVAASVFFFLFWNWICCFIDLIWRREGKRGLNRIFKLYDSTILFFNKIISYKSSTITLFIEDITYMRLLFFFFLLVNQIRSIFGKFYSYLKMHPTANIKQAKKKTSNFWNTFFHF